MTNPNPNQTETGRQVAIERKRGARNSAAYVRWCNMKSRCYNKRSSSYKNYGGRGIMVCDRWKYSFWNFLEDMGEPPNGKSIDRIDVNGHYEPGNCRWVTTKENNENRRDNIKITYKGITLCASVWAVKFNMSETTIKRRILDLGWTPERTFETPVRKVVYRSGTEHARTAKWVVVGWLDGHDFIGLPEEAANRPNARLVFQPIGKRVSNFPLLSAHSTAETLAAKPKTGDV